MMEDYEGRPSPIDPRFPSQCKTMSTWGSRCLVLAPRSLGGSKRIPCDRSPPPTHPRTLANGGKYRPTTNFETSTSADPATGPIPLGIRGACTDTGNRVNAVRSLSAAIPMLLIARNLTSRSRNPAAAYRNLITISRKTGRRELHRTAESSAHPGCAVGFCTLGDWPEDHNAPSHRRADSHHRMKCRNTPIDRDSPS